MNNTIRQFLATFVVAMTSLMSCEMNAQTAPSVTPSTLPDHLPIGDYAIRSYMLTNADFTRGVLTRVLGTSLVYGDQNGYQHSVPYVKPGVVFSSLEDYSNRLAITTYQLLDTLKQCTNIASSIRVYAALFFYTKNQDQAPTSFIYSLVTDVDIGPVENITWASFTNLTPMMENAILYVPNLSYYRVKFDQGTNDPYIFTWSNGVTNATGKIDGTFYWPELTTNNFVVLNSPYYQGTNQVDAVISNSQDTREFTRCGEWLYPRPVTQRSRSQVDMGIPRGANAYLQSSYDYVHWQDIGYVDGSTLTNFASFRVRPGPRYQYFRARYN